MATGEVTSTPAAISTPMTETDPQANEGGRLSHSEDLDEHPRKRIKAAETTDFRTKGVAPIQRQ